MTITVNFDEVTRSTAHTHTKKLSIVKSSFAAVAAAIVGIYYRIYISLCAHLIFNERTFLFLLSVLVYLILLSFNALNLSDVCRVECDAEILHEDTSNGHLAHVLQQSCSFVSRNDSYFVC